MASLALLLAPMAFSVTGCFTFGAALVAGMTHQDPRFLPAGDAIYLDHGSSLTLHLRDGSSVSGRFAGRELLATDRYRTRFEAHAARGGWSPLALGESLTVESTDGKRVEASFVGYAMRALVLRGPRAGEPTRVPFESTRSIERSGGGIVSIDSLLAADVRGDLPSAEAIALDVVKVGNGIAIRQGGPPQVFPLAEIERVTVRGENGSAAGVIVLGVVVDIVLLSVYLNSLEGSSSGCDYRPPIVVRATERPFDRSLARFVDENLAWPDSLSGPQATTRGTH